MWNGAAGRFTRRCVEEAAQTGDGHSDFGSDRWRQRLRRDFDPRRCASAMAARLMRSPSRRQLGVGRLAEPRWRHFDTSRRGGKAQQGRGAALLHEEEEKGKSRGRKKSGWPRRRRYNDGVGSDGWGPTVTGAARPQCRAHCARQREETKTDRGRMIDGPHAENSNQFEMKFSSNLI
jgi:hypothetical protein